MPIKARIDMLATGIRTPVGVKTFGHDLVVIERLSREALIVIPVVYLLITRLTICKH